MSSNAFVDYLASKRPLIESCLAHRSAAPQRATEEMELYAYGPLRHFVASGGKRTRPALALLGCEAVGGEVEQAISCALAIEDFQSAALIHDDIADEGELRRGEPCTYLTEGIGIAINVGDLGIVRTFAGILEDSALDDTCKLRVLAEIAQMEQRTVEGQALDLGWVRDGRWDITTSDYLEMATHKTAFYSAATPLATGAISGGGSDAQIEALRAFGLDAGLAFQLQDDLLNLVGDPKEQGKDFLSDITEGKRTMVVTWSLEHLETPERAELISILSSHEQDPARLSHAVDLMRSCGAIDAVGDFAQELASAAKSHLTGAEFAGDTPRVLEAMADFFVERLG